jgi:hypothetical protein
MRFNGGVQRIATTVVALVGEHAPACLDQLGQAANVTTVRPLSPTRSSWLADPVRSQGRRRSHDPASNVAADIEGLVVIATWLAHRRVGCDRKGRRSR